MPSGRDRPGMFASRDDPRTKFAYAQPLNEGQSVGNPREQPRRRRRAQCHLQRTILGAPQGQYYAYRPDSARVTQPVDSTPSNADIVEHLTARQGLTASRSSKSSHVIDSVAHLNSLFFEGPQGYSSDPMNATQAVLLRERRESYFRGCIPVDSYHPSAQQHTGLDQTSRSLAVPGQPHTAEGSCSLQTSQRSYDKPLPASPPVRQVAPPGEGGLRVTNPDPVDSVPLCPDDHQTNIMGQNELWFGYKTSSPRPRSLPEELDGIGPPPISPVSSHAPQAVSTRLNPQIHYKLHSGQQSPTELDSPTDLQDQRVYYQNTIRSDDSPPILPEIEPIMTEPMFNIDEGVEQRQAATWYDHFRGARAWGFDETMEARYGMMLGSQSTPNETGAST